MSDEPFIIASDGLIARNSGPWAQDKLRNLDTYSGIVTTAMKGKFTGGIVFVDLMAGSGRCVDTRTIGRPEFAGSTIRALEARYPFARVIAVEAHEPSAEALRQRVHAHPRSHLCEVIGANCNAPDVVRRVREATEGALTIMFVDLLGTEVDMATIRQMTSGRSVDLIFTWPEMDVVRNRGMLMDQPERWNAFFGTTQWQNIATLTGPALRLRALQKLYLQQLGAFEYVHTKFVASVRNRRGRVLYRPLLASRHPLAVRFWEKAAAPTPPTLFEL